MKPQSRPVVQACQFVHLAFFPQRLVVFPQVPIGPRQFFPGKFLVFPQFLNNGDVHRNTDQAHDHLQ